MANLEAADIGHAGEKIVEKLLISKGYTNVIRDTWQPGATDIKADGNPDSLLVQVKTALQPNKPVNVNEADKVKIVAHAAKNKRVAWAAYVVIDQNKSLVGNVQWEKLS